MPTIQVEANVSIDTLVRAVEQLSEADLRRLAEHVVALSAKRSASCASKGEAELLLRINRRLAPDLQARYDHLLGKRDAETLTGLEHEELFGLTQQAETVDAGRVEALTQLAALRGTTLSHLARELELHGAVDA